jgi:hypothetical protein
MAEGALTAVLGTDPYAPVRDDVAIRENVGECVFAKPTVTCSCPD